MSEAADDEIELGTPTPSLVGDGPVKGATTGIDENPYVGPRPFDETDAVRGRYHGREHEARDLLALVSRERLVLFYSQSGAGKSSLLRASLLPGLRQLGFDVLPIARVSGARPESETGTTAEEDINPIVYNVILSLNEGLPADVRATRGALLHVSLSQFLGGEEAPGPPAVDAVPVHVVEPLAVETALERMSNDGKAPAATGSGGEAGVMAPTVLVIDQFEEIVTVYPNRWHERRAFFEQLRDTMERLPLLWVVLTLREDYVAALEPYAELMPSRLRARYYMQRMGVEAALNAVRKPAENFGRPFAPGVAETLVDNLRRVRVQFGDEPELGQYVEPVQLQVVCYQLWEQIVLTQGPAQGTAGEANHIQDRDLPLDYIDQALTWFYRDALAETLATPEVIAGGVDERRIRAWFDREVITDNGIRNSVLVNVQTGHTGSLANAAVDKLLQRYILRAELRAGGSWVELVHDRFVEPIREDNAEWFPQHLSTLQRQAALWEDQGRVPGLLLQGTALLDAERWAAEHTEEVEPIESEFLDLCRDARAARERQLRQQRMITWLAVVAIIVSAIAMLAAVANYFQSIATDSRQLAAVSSSLAHKEIDTQLLLSAEAYKRAQQQPWNLADVESSLLAAGQCCSDSLETFLNGHQDRVWDVAFSQDGNLLASSSDDGAIIIWDVTARQIITTIINPASSASVYTLAFSPKENLLASGDGDGTILLRDTKTWQTLGSPLHAHAFNVHSLKFSDDGTLLVSAGGDGKVVVWDMSTRSPIQKFSGHTDWVWDVDIAADDHTVASVGEDKTVRLWYFNGTSSITSTLVLTGPHTSATTSIAFNDDAKRPLMVTGDKAGYLVLWDMKAWQQVRAAPTPTARRTLFAGGALWSVDFVPNDPQTLVAAYDIGSIRRLHIQIAPNFADSKLVQQKLGMIGHAFGILRAAISPRGDLVGVGGYDKLVSLWKLDEASNVLWQPDKISSMRVLSEPNHLEVFDRSGTVSLWNTTVYTTGTAGQRQPLTRVTITPTVVFSVSALSIDGTLVATGGTDATVRIWEAATGHLRAKLAGTKEAPGHQATITALAFSADGQRLASADSSGVTVVWQVADGIQVARLTDQRGAMTSLLYLPDGRLVGGGCASPITFPIQTCGRGAVFVWSFHRDKVTRSVLPNKSGPVLSLANNPAASDELAVGTSNGAITVWDLKDDRVILNIVIAKRPPPAIQALAFSPDGRMLAVGKIDNLIHLFNTSTGQPFGEAFGEHDDDPVGLAFSHDGYSLYSAALDDTVVIHDLQPEHWLHRACRFASRNLTKDEWQRYMNSTARHDTCTDADRSGPINE